MIALGLKLFFQLKYVKWLENMITLISLIEPLLSELYSKDSFQCIDRKDWILQVSF